MDYQVLLTDLMILIEESTLKLVDFGLFQRAKHLNTHSRDRQGRVSVRRLGLVYTSGGVLRDLHGTSRDTELY